MPLKILFADDSMTAQNMGTKILTEAGYEVVAVSNGSAALKKIAEHKPDLVILDVYMPGYSGLEVCEKLRNSMDTLNTPVLLTVGKMEPYRREDANRVKADGIIIKPFEATDLLAIIKQLEERIVPVTTPAVAEQTMYLERPTLLTDEYRQEEFSVQSASITQHPPITPVRPAIEVPDYMASTSAFSDLLHTAPPPPAAIPEAQAVETPAPAEDIQPEPAASAAETSTPFHVAPAQWNWERAPEVANYSTNSETSAMEEPAPQRTQKIPRYEEPEVATAPPVSVDPAPEEIAVPPRTDEPSAPSLSVPDMLMSNAGEIASTADAHGSIPAVDPALVTDRTELASSFATRFGVKNLEPVSDAAESEPTAVEVEHTVEAPDTNFESPAQPEAIHAVDDDFDTRVAAAMSAYEQQEAIAEEPESLPAEVETAEPVADTEQTELQPAEPVSEDVHTGSLPASFVENHPRAVADTAESEIQHYGHEIAASITSELPAASAAASSISANPKVISEIVHRVLDRIKPHLVEEIIRELTSEKKAE